MKQTSEVWEISEVYTCHLGGGPATWSRLPSGS